VGEVTGEGTSVGVNDGVGWTVTVFGGLLQNVTKLMAESEKGRMSQRLICSGFIGLDLWEQEYMGGQQCLNHCSLLS
jgi:hypothetical protein